MPDQFQRPVDMLAAVLHGPRDLRLERRPLPDPKADELLVRVAFSGVCGSDAHEYVNPSLSHLGHDPHPVTGHTGPLVPGHEWAGVVVAVGDHVPADRIGTYVASGAGVSCSECVQCLEGRTNLCEAYSTAGMQRDGGLAEFCAIPAAACVEADFPGADRYVAGLAQPMSVAVHALRDADPEPGSPVLVVGMGGIGTFLTYAAVERGADVTVVARSHVRRSLARRLGARAIAPEGLTVELQRHFPVVFEASGNAEGLSGACAALRSGGNLVLIGLHGEGTELPLREITLRELSIVGTVAHCAGQDLPEAMRVLSARKSGWLDVSPTVFPLSHLITQGLERTGRIKTLFAPWAQSSMTALDAWPQFEQSGFSGV